MASIIVRRLQSLKNQLAQLADKVDKLAQDVEKTEQSAKVVSPKPPAKKAAPKKKPAVRSQKKKAAAKKTPAGTKAVTAIDRVFAVIEKAPEEGMDTAALRKETGLEGRSLSNVLQRLKKQGKISSPKRGIYKSA